MSVTFDFLTLTMKWPLLAKGLLTTVWLTLISTILGLSVGILLAALRTNAPAGRSILLGILVEFIRNTPFVVQLFFIVFGLPALGIRLSGAEAAIIAMSINLAAYSSEIIRAGISVSPNGQQEAGRVLGLSPRQIFYRVILPPALQGVYPALVSQCIIVMLGSSVVSQVAFEDLTFAANLIQSQTFLSFEVYLVTAGLYLLLSLILRQSLLFIGRKWLRTGDLC